MIEVHKTIREGVDTKVAVKSAMTRAMSVSSPSDSMRKIKMLSKISATFGVKFRAMTKRLLVRFKQIAHPILFRFRNYLNQPLLEQMSRIESQLLILGEGRQLSNLAPAQLDRIEQYALASARRVAIGCGSGNILIRSEVGYILCGSSDHAVIACLLDSGDLERGTRLLIQRYLKPHDVFIDIGANLGLHTLAAARAMQGKGRIFAFEPFEPTQRLLAESIRINEFTSIVEIHQAAVSNRAGRKTLYLGGSSGHHSLYKIAQSSGALLQTVDVPLVKLSDIVPESISVSLIKIDVEGAELDVLDGAKSLIASKPSIAMIVEFGFAHLQRTGHTTQDWLAAFKNLGFEFRAVNAHTGQLEAWTEEQLEAVDSVNLFFARPQSEAWSRALESA